MAEERFGGGGGCRVLSNVRCLSEGVDVPALDAVMFMDSKGSLVDVVQSVGRVMRKAEGKQYGYIIIPIVVPEEEDPESALDDNDRYKVVWQVLRALRSHDERLDAEINTFQYRGSNSEGHIQIGRSYGCDVDSEDIKIQDGQYTLDDFGRALLARLVLKVGDREYIENWAKDVAEVMPALIERLTKICEHSEHGYKQYKPAFTRYLKGLRSCVNDNVSEEDAINMLAQQIVTKPIFEKLFSSDGFAMKNSVSQTIDEMLKDIDAKDGLNDIDEQLNDFYHSVDVTLSQIDNADGRQKVITSMYEKFFKNAFPKDQTINGVVYTPQEIVDFIIHSVADTLKQEFGLDVNDENVNILDPFTGTGTFIARLMETGVITKDDLERKYRNELFANEITLLAYYIATVNIENTFTKMMNSNEYVPFENILLTDTFNIEKICKEGSTQTYLFDEAYFKRNRNMIKKENEASITVILGNPPYGATQRSANDNAKKRTYDGGVDKSIEKHYLANELFDGKKGLVNSVYDNYIRAFRWSTDRMGDNDGIIAFVTPNGWLTGSAFVGFRKCIEKEFAKIYVFNLRGDATTQGEMRRKEGDGVFGEGSRTAISITLLVKRKGFKGKSKTVYAKVDDYMKRSDKFNLLTKSNSFPKMEKEKALETLNIKDNGDWIIERNENFQKLIPLAGDTHKKFEKHNEETIFVGYTNGYKTNRDIWSYNFSKEETSRNISRMIDEYNSQLKNGKQIFDPTKISWDGTLENCFNKGETAKYDSSNVVSSLYRPFCKKWFYSDKMLVNSSYQNPRLFPMPETKNLMICVSSVGDKKDFSCLITDKMTDLHLVGTSQCFPLYWYEDIGITKRAERKVNNWFGESKDLVRHDGISDHALNIARRKYGASVTKEDIFSYVYGYLHSPEYRTAFAEDLKLSLPKIGFVDDAVDFQKLVQIGGALAELHLNYENYKAPDGIKFSRNLDDVLNDPKLCRVNKIKVMQDDGKIIFNQHLTIENIPSRAFEYVVNGRNVLKWIEEQYQISTDKDSGIINDPNEYAGGSYILKLILSMITVSLKTMEIIDGMPKLNFD